MTVGFWPAVERTGCACLNFSQVKIRGASELFSFFSLAPVKTLTNNLCVILTMIQHSPLILVKRMNVFASFSDAAFVPVEGMVT